MSSEVEPVGKLRKFRLADLHIRFIPIVTDKRLWNRDMSLPNSPHVELMRIFKDYGFDKERIKKSRYFRDRQHRHEIGVSKWNDKKIWRHIKEGRYRVFNLLRKEGWNKHRSRKDPIKVLATPFWCSRHRCKEPFLKGPEIWNGAGRCAAAFVLGFDVLRCQLVVDAKSPGDAGKFKDKLINVEGLWTI